jgi:hypothetical protein
MNPIEIPFATLPIKVIMGCACVLIVFAVLWWGVPRFMAFLRIVTGRAPRKPGTGTLQLVLGFFVYAIIFAPAVLAAAIFLQLMTTPPSVVSEEGVAGGGGVLIPRKTIAWAEVERVDCVLRRDHAVEALRLVSGSKRVELTSIYDLTSVRDVIWAHVRRSALRSCSVALRGQHF